MPKLKDEHVLYVRSMGKALRVTAWFTDEAAANAYMASARGRQEGVVAQFGELILLADMHDKGVTIPAGHAKNKG